MKKYLLMIAALLLCPLAHSQEAESTGDESGLTVVSRLDLGYAIPLYEGDDPSFNHDNSAIYTKLEGSFSERVSYMASLHWIAGSWADTRNLYKCLGYSDSGNLVDYLNVTFNFGSFDFTVGKDCMAIGGFEYDEWDWDCHPAVQSSMWNCLNSYQWGAKAAWTSPSDHSQFIAQFTTSPWGVRPFASSLYAGALSWRGDWDNIRTIYSVAAFQRAPGDWFKLITLGNQFDLGDFTLTVDYFNAVGWDDATVAYEYEPIANGGTLRTALQWAPGDNFNLTASYKHEWLPGGEAGSRRRLENYGLVAQWMPFGENLRFHGMVAYDGAYDAVACNIGATYFFHLPRRK